MISPARRRQNRRLLERPARSPQPGSFHPSSCLPGTSKREAGAGSGGPFAVASAQPTHSPRVAAEHRRKPSRALRVVYGNRSGVKGRPETRKAPGSIGGLPRPTWPPKDYPERAWKGEGAKGKRVTSQSGRSAEDAAGGNWRSPGSRVRQS